MGKRTALVTIEVDSPFGPRHAAVAVADALSRVSGNGSVKMSVTEIRMSGMSDSFKVSGRCENCGVLLLDLDESREKCADCLYLPSPPF